MYQQVAELTTLLAGRSSGRSLPEVIRLISAMLYRGVCDQQQNFFLHFNNFLTAYLYSVQTLLSSTKKVTHVPNQKLQRLFTSIFESKTLV